jgi:cell division protein YceG involved in septum cleavage
MALYLLITLRMEHLMSLSVFSRVGLLGACLAWSCLSLPAAAQSKTYQVKSGDTVDHVIRQTMADSPIKPTILRQVLMSQNPEAFTKSSPRVLLAGAVLTLPSTQEVLRQYQTGKPTDASAATKPGGYTTADINMNERKNWVRYP